MKAGSRQNLEEEKEEVTSTMQFQPDMLKLPTYNRYLCRWFSADPGSCSIVEHFKIKELTFRVGPTTRPEDTVPGPLGAGEL